MIIAHGPAGYLLTKFFAAKLLRDTPQGTSSRRYNLLILAGIIGGIMPDFDFVYHIFIDSDKTSHHSYITHMPVFWLSLMLISVITGSRLLKKPFFSAISITLFSAAMLHLVCDTLTGEIYWLYPFSMHPYNVFSVHGTYIWWVHNYMYHWTFLIEITIVTSAMIIFLRIPDTIRYLLTMIRGDRKLQQILVRSTVCLFGISIIMLIGSIKFDFDKRVFQKVIKLKHYVSRNVSVIK